MNMLINGVYISNLNIVIELQMSLCRLAQKTPYTAKECLRIAQSVATSMMTVSFKYHFEN